MQENDTMNAAQQQYRSCFETFVDDLRQLIDKAIREAVASELGRLMESEKRRRKSISRASTRRRATAEKKDPKNGASTRGRRKASNGQTAVREVSEETVAEQAPTPPPLFVHKRSRDGQIQHLSRRNEEELPQQSSVAG